LDGGEEQYQMTSLRRTILVWVTVTMALVGIAAATASYYFARHEADNLLDDQLRQIALHAGEGLSTGALPGARRKPEHDVAVQIWDAAGNAIIRPSRFDIPRQPELGFTDVWSADRNWRVYTSSDGQRTVQVAQRWSMRNELAANAAFGAALPIVGAIPVAWLTVIWAINRLLRRLAGFAETLAQRSVDAKDPVPLGNVPAEIAPLNVAINALIGRHQQAVDRQRQFVSDAAHEIRTPLAALQIQVDNLKTHAEGAQREAIDEMNGGVRRACALVEQLLRLARVDGGASSSRRLDVSLNDLVAAVVADHVALATQRNVDLGLADSDLSDVQLSDPEVRVLFANLIDNAIRYTPSGGKIDVILKRDGSDALIEVIDSGCGIPNAALPRIFDRFFRAAPPDIEGTGLGLAIAKAVAERNGFRLSIVNREDTRGTVARVEIPVRPETPEHCS
jgi:two-component system, OmpR family, sensor kinase